jgi:ubiquitin carboxyl-terminal hydrolase 36/42
MLPQGFVKIGRDIEFPADLDLTAHMTDKTVETAYSLYAVLVHEGQSCNSGHYHCFVKASNGIWYSLNDQSVHQVSLATVLKQKGYILFYQKKSFIPSDRPLPLNPSEPSNKRSKVETSHIDVPKTVQAPLMQPTTKQASPIKSSPVKKSKEENISLDQDLVISKSMWHLGLIPKDLRPLPNCNLSAWSIKNIS